ncbi:KAP family NTPase (plasmid) [Ralstonia pseudosolanacearum]|uniref:KAP family P-loop NTPase fold protein n=1 Tax=Ralstonia pseudosolanacearum TaxID=1310165 RepID=UPI000AF2ECC2|nr:P-loop NTPase fold protein [Ralstonia pseudosolanacearum]MDO3515279.1 P-loop NTPase fold protein [Ralstonia pseudosolanacearum]MDO3544616.1 P-loop NTPase fold protein [Ralstonia pseudosolanacearum]UZF22253.1 KAP family NTPase [Ralstonia solanacearum]
MNRLLVHLSAWRARRRARLGAEATRAERLDQGIGAEAPIRTASEDRLRRADFAGRIADVLSELSLREGRVFAIRGGWGFGKSSLKNLITERLDAKSDTADWLDFNPWQWGDGDAIARALFSQIADRLGGEHSKTALARAEALRRYGAILTGTGAPLKEAGGSSHLISTVLTNASVVAVASAIGFDLPTVARVAFVLAVLSVCTPWLGRMLSHLGRDRGGEPLGKVREALEARLRELDRPLVVFVDDIDRLEPEQIRMLLRQVKANANLPNIVFVLLFQPSIVERALDPVADGNGRAFLEKVVQASFDLPTVPVSIVHSIFGDELSELAGPYATEANGFSQTRWGNAFVGCIQPLLHNMRDARRLISSIAMHMPLHVAGDVFEVNIIDFLVLEALRVFEPDLHEVLFRERELVLQERRYQGDGRRDVDKAAAERLLDVVSEKEKRRVIARNALKELFPPLEWAYGGTNYADGFRTSWLTAKRVCAPRYFPRYFELQTAAGEMSKHRFVAFLDATATEDGLAAAIADVEADGLLPSLVVRFDESVDRLPVENAAVLLPAMFGIAQKLASLGGVDPFNSPWLSAWRATSWFLERIPKGVRGDLALEALRKTKALAVAAILIHLSDPAERKEGTDDASDPALDLNTVETMKAEWLRLIRSLATDGNTLITEPDLMSLLYRWRDYTGSLDEPREWMMQAIRTDEGFANMVTRMMSRGTRHSVGDRVSTPHNTFNRETINDFIGIDVAKTRCDEINFAEIPEHEEALRTLHSSLEVWLGLRKRDPFDF